MRFTKMQGCGNDYVYVDLFREKLTGDVAKLAVAIADRHFGVGGDGLILICPSERADARMRMFNADGSESEMCGNGLRCVAKYVYDHGIARKDRADHRDRPRHPDGGPGGEGRQGPARPRGHGRADPRGREDPDHACPATRRSRPRSSSRARRSPSPACRWATRTRSRSWTRSPTGLVHQVGPLVEKHEAFPRRVNVEFVKVNSRTDAHMRVWERGSGETLACGTGACAVAVAGVLTGRFDRKVTIHLLGGDLDIEWARRQPRVQDRAGRRGVFRRLAGVARHDRRPGPPGQPRRRPGGRRPLARLRRLARRPGRPPRRVPPPRPRTLAPTPTRFAAGG